jgi:hypothetical protein
MEPWKIQCGKSKAWLSHMARECSNTYEYDVENSNLSTSQILRTEEICL